MSIFSTLLKNEIRLVFRTSEALLSPAFFVFLIFLLFQMGTMAPSINQAYFLSWLAPLLAGWLRMSRTFELEVEGGVMEAIHLIPGASFRMILAKWFVNFSYLLFLELFSIILAILLFNLNQPLDFLRALSLPFILGSFGYSLLATFFSGLLRDHPRRDMILPVIGYPLLIPLVLGVVKGVVFTSTGFSWDGAWIQMLLGFDIIYLILVLMVWNEL